MIGVIYLGINWLFASSSAHLTISLTLTQFSYLFYTDGKESYHIRTNLARIGFNPFYICSIDDQFASHGRVHSLYDWWKMETFFFLFCIERISLRAHWKGLPTFTFLLTLKNEEGFFSIFCVCCGFLTFQSTIYYTAEVLLQEIMFAQRIVREKIDYVSELRICSVQVTNGKNKPGNVISATYTQIFQKY